MTAYRPGLEYAVIGCKLKQNANEGCNSYASFVLLHVLFYLWSLLQWITGLGDWTKHSASTESFQDYEANGGDDESH